MDVITVKYWLRNTSESSLRPQQSEIRVHLRALEPENNLQNSVNLES